MAKYQVFNKYHNKSCVCNQNHRHASIGEAGYCDQLMLLFKAKEIRGYRSQVKFDLKVNDKHVTTHIVDFMVENNDKKFEVHEYKGFATDAWDIKRRLFEAIYPEIPYIVITKTSRWLK